MLYSFGRIGAALVLLSAPCQAAPAVSIPASSYVEVSLLTLKIIAPCKYARMCPRIVRARWSPLNPSLQATMAMPYYDLVEPITSWTTNTLGRLDYWGGVQRYLYDLEGEGHMIVPTAADGDHSEETCFTTGSGQSPVSLFPNVSAFPDTPDAYPSGGGCAVRGVACVSYTLRAPDYDPATGFDGNCESCRARANVFVAASSAALLFLSHLAPPPRRARAPFPDTLFVDAASLLPLRFHFVGFNVVLGSHYDEYIFDYLKVSHIRATIKPTLKQSKQPRMLFKWDRLQAFAWWSFLASHVPIFLGCVITLGSRQRRRLGVRR